MGRRYSAAGWDSLYRPAHQRLQRERRLAARTCRQQRHYRIRQGLCRGAGLEQLRRSATAGYCRRSSARARLYEFLNNQGTFTGQFIADPTATTFPVTALATDRLGEMLGASLGLRLNPEWNAFVSYDAEIRGRDVANLVSGGVKVKW